MANEEALDLITDVPISDLEKATRINPADLFVLEQDGVAKSLSGQLLISYVMSLMGGHGSITNIVKTGTNGLVDSYSIVMEDEKTFSFDVTNGNGIKSVEKTATDGLEDTYTITFDNGNKKEFTVKNGEKGDKGDPTPVWIKYASQMPSEESPSFGDLPDAYIGIYSGDASTAPKDWKMYSWYQWKGFKGDAGERGRTIFYSNTETQTREDRTFNPSQVSTRGDTLRISDLILDKSGNLFEITRLPTNDNYVIYGHYLTSLVGPEGPSRDSGTGFYETTKAPPGELSNSVYVFDLNTINGNHNELRSGDFIFDSDYNIFRIEAIGATNVRASWVTTWSINTGGTYLPERFDYIIMNSATEGSYKQFRVSVDDSGTLTATEIIKMGTAIFEDYSYWGAFEGTLSFVIGMTWYQFCDSEYNTQNFTVSGDVINEPSGCYLLYKTSSSTYRTVSPNDKIVDGREYLWDMR